MWEKLWPAIPGAILAALITAFIYHANIDALKLAQADALSRQEKIDQASCNTGKAITEGVSDEYEKSISALDSQLNDIQLRGPAAACIPIVNGGSAGGHHGSPAVGKLPAQNGVDSGALLSFAGDAEAVRLRLLACQDFVRKNQAAAQ